MTLAASDTGDDFPLDGGRACLDLVATLGRRHREPVERVPDGAALARWTVRAGLLPGEPGVPEAGAAQIRRFHALREAVNRAVRARMGGRKVALADVELINAAAAHPDLAPRLSDSATGASARPGPGADLHEAVLSTLARDAISLLTDPRADRIRECAHPNCSLLFFDASQAGRRRWCSMDRCGNLVKVSGYRRRVGNR